MIFANVIKDLRCNHCRFRMGPNSNTSVFIKERRGRLETQKHRDREGGTVKTEAEIRVMHVSTSPGKSRITASYQKLGDRHGTDGPSELPEGNSPSNLSWNSILHKTMHFCCFMPPSLWQLITAVSGNKFRGPQKHKHEQETRD
ncbi:hypothetical protein mRhiFer1_008023 [Rhinolophus ferrumequinum]|uniref:Uncharacterized protein n=1 Tax=Rhinolophus ferrumequinum TaxID=59479 RepID=A0A7J7WQS5_RHIFE|nr:hypothetical protein mRhiFer1_008023 [Rhinolophus ferrumequinum]